MDSRAESEVRRLIQSTGPISFARFMEVALYHPEAGYYAQTRAERDGGDYYTSPAVHPAFSALIAAHLEALWRALDRPDPFYAVELGAGGGRMARDIAEYAPRIPSDFNSALRYIATDRHPRHPPSESMTTCPPLGVVGCVLSNELLDAFPTHRFEKRGGRLLELYVDVGADGALRSVFAPPSTPALEQRLEGLGVVPPDGARGEVCVEIADWARQVSGILERGYVITIDYGREVRELYAPERERGTLQTYYRHIAGSSPYQRIGRQDITAHVDFTTVSREGRRAGLHPVALMTQAAYLDRLGLIAWLARLRARQLPPRVKRANLDAMRGLADPQGLGGFRTLLQAKGAPRHNLDDLFPSPERIAELPIPVMSPSSGSGDSAFAGIA